VLVHRALVVRQIHHALDAHIRVIDLHRIVCRKQARKTE